MAVRALNAGAANFRTKPLNDEDLLDSIRQSLTFALEARIGPDQKFGNIRIEEACGQPAQSRVSQTSIGLLLDQPKPLESLFFVPTKGIGPQPYCRSKLRNPGKPFVG